MRQPTKRSSQKFPADSQRLVLFSQALMQAGSRVEERSWERNLDALVTRLMKSRHQDVIDAALDFLLDVQSDAYDALMESLEAVSESCTVEHEGTLYDVLLVALPILAWTRFTIPSGPIGHEAHSRLSTMLQDVLLASDAHARLAPTLFSMDQLPRSPADTYSLTQRLAQAALRGDDIAHMNNAPSTAPFLADTRYLLGVAYAPAGMPIFKWQDMHLPATLEKRRSELFALWRAQASAELAPLLPGCNIELLLPDAYYHACRQADKAIRPALIQAADYFLTQSLNVASNELHASIGAFSEDAAEDLIEEYRIGFSVGSGGEIVYGIVWPLYGPEQDGLTLERSDDVQAKATQSPLLPPDMSPLEEILTLLRQAGITHIKHHEERYAMEFCEDCGAPLYPDAQGELVHAEMPEDASVPPNHLH